MKTERIIKRASRQYGIPFVFTHEMWEEVGPVSKKKLLERYYPKQISQILHIFKHTKNLKLAIDIWEKHGDEIRELWTKYYMANTGKFVAIINDPNRSLEEKRLQGWIPRSEFKEFNPDYGHIMCIKSDLMLPLNIPRTIDQMKRLQRHYKKFIPIKWFFYEQYGIPLCRFDNQ